jgi:hypothetical protein
MPQPFDFTTSEILDWELENALDKQEIGITQHAADAATDDNLTLIQLLEAVLVGRPVSKDLPDNKLLRLPGINFEHQTGDARWYRVKVAWVNEYLIITAHTLWEQNEHNAQRTKNRIRIHQSQWSNGSDSPCPHQNTGGHVWTGTPCSKHCRSVATRGTAKASLCNR